MSVCGVCIYSDYEGDSNDFFHEEIRRARKEYSCCECGKKIEKEERYAYYKGTSDGSFFTERCCLICDEIGGAFCCDGRIFGNLWDGMWEIYEAMNTACFDRLITPQAKAELRKRWTTWKFGYNNRMAAKRRAEAMLKRARGIAA